MVYSPPKCTCHGKTNTSKQFHEPTRMSTCPIPCPESSPTPSHMPKPNASKISSFQNKIFLFSKTCYRVSVKYWTSLRGELLDNAPKQSWSSSEVICWTTLQGNSSENIPSKFPTQTFFVFLSISFSCHALTPNILGCPNAYRMHDVNPNNSC